MIGDTISGFSYIGDTGVPSTTALSEAPYECAASSLEVDARALSNYPLTPSLMRWREAHRHEARPRGWFVLPNPPLPSLLICPLLCEPTTAT